ncbi:alpha/beta fold hydrolase [Streptomyces sp. NPDC001410]|uniref:alpha/beta fold hydrolase n=1 Tax=Streptomyces sp. NPDC001410 TaxID=3364574 RepID=UPI0036B775F1
MDLDFFTSYDGTKLAYHATGDGPALICLPGGPMQDSAYLGDLGGLTAHRRLIRLDLRGTGRSARPEDSTTYRCDRLVDDVEALRRHLGLDRIDLLAHSAGANLAVSYVSRHPERVGRLALITPSILAVGVAIDGEDRLRAARLRSDEPWFPEAFAALEAVVAGQGTATSWQAVAPFWYGRWDDAARAHQAAQDEQRNAEAAAAYAAPGAFTPDTTRAALARFRSPVLVLAGEADVAGPPRAMAEVAGLFPHGRLVIHPGTAHFPWLDDGPRFAATVTNFLNETETL